MKTWTIEIPDSLEMSEKDAKTFLAAKLYENGSLSLGQAAALAGYSKRLFIEILGNYNVSIFSIGEADLKKDILNAKNYSL
ncbi:MAG: UPF0175 family protein [Ferruginibacter sp.]